MFFFAESRNASNEHSHREWWNFWRWYIICESNGAAVCVSWALRSCITVSKWDKFFFSGLCKNYVAQRSFYDLDLHFLSRVIKNCFGKIRCCCSQKNWMEAVISLLTVTFSKCFLSANRMKSCCLKLLNSHVWIIIKSYSYQSLDSCSNFQF